MLRSKVEYSSFLIYLDPNIAPLFIISVIFFYHYNFSASYLLSLVDLPSPLHDFVFLIISFLFYKSLSSKLYSLVIFPSSFSQYLPTSAVISILLPYLQLALCIFHKFLHVFSCFLFLSLSTSFIPIFVSCASLFSNQVLRGTAP